MENKPTYQALEQRIRDLERERNGDKEIFPQWEDSDRMYHRILEHMAVTVIIADDQGNMMYVGPNTIKIFGLSQEQVYNQKNIQRVLNGMACDIQILKKQQEIDNIEWSMNDSSGKEHFLLISAKLVNLQSGTVLYIIHDITERRQAEQERLSHAYFFESMDRVNRAIQGTNDLEQMMRNVLNVVLSIFKTDRAFLGYPCDPNASSWNIPMECTRPEYPGAASIKVEMPMDEESANLNRALRLSDNPVTFGPAPGFDHPLPAMLTEHFSIQSQIMMAIFPKVGKPWTFGTHQCSHVRVWTPEEAHLLEGIGQRIADGLSSFLMYNKLRDSEEKYRTMMEAFVEPLIICSHDLIIEYMNPAMIRRLGRAAIGENCYAALHGLEAQCDWCAFDKILLGEKFETTIKSPLDDRHYRISNMPNKNKDGTISKMAIYRDITDYQSAVSEKERVEAQLIQAQKMESIGNLAGGIAHDFNNILSSIIGFTELALDDAEQDSMIEDHLQEVYTAGKRAKELVAQILAFARQTEEELKPVQIGLVVKEVLKFIRSSIPKTIEIKSNNMDSDALIKGNQTQIHQIMMNLFTNAASAMEENNGVLTVSLKDTVIEKRSVHGEIGLKGGDYVELSVSDTGTGIPPDIIDSIFDPYFTTKGPGQGTGMGLAVVHGIVKSYGGTITVESIYGEGTTFTIYLPVTRKRKGKLQYKHEQLPMGTEKILFVDDEAPIIKMGALILEGFGYSVTTRTSSLEALELFRAKPTEFDLVITDMTMPNMTGDKLAVELTKIRPDIPIILCTGYSRKIPDATAAEIGIKAFVYKPVVKADLAKTVRKALDKAKG